MRSKLTRILEKLRAALFASLAESEAGQSALAEVVEEGLVLYLVIDDPASGEEPEELRLVPSLSSEDEPSPDFRIDQQDLTLLRSLGIDPTRTLRRRRRARRK